MAPRRQGGNGQASSSSSCPARRKWEEVFCRRKRKGKRARRPLMSGQKAPPTLTLDTCSRLPLKVFSLLPPPSPRNAVERFPRRRRRRRRRPAEFSPYRLREWNGGERDPSRGESTSEEPKPELAEDKRSVLLRFLPIPRFFLLHSPHPPHLPPAVLRGPRSGHACARFLAAWFWLSARRAGAHSFCSRSGSHARIRRTRLFSLHREDVFPSPEEGNPH